MAGGVAVDAGCPSSGEVGAAGVGPDPGRFDLGGDADGHLGGERISIRI
ncbi:hypothetical protein [Frankia canadensis]|nr:hypothetical protein [Frankia canadensis]